jgi:hypothetical protein
VSFELWDLQQRGGVSGAWGGTSAHNPHHQLPSIPHGPWAVFVFFLLMALTKELGSTLSLS